MDTDLLKTLPGNRWKRSGFGVKLWLYNIAIHTQGRPFIFKELPKEHRSLKYFKKSIVCEYIIKVGRIKHSAKNNDVYQWVIV